jgi:hypothetical protein
MQKGLQPAPGSSSGSQQWQTMPFSTQVECAPASLHCQFPSLQHVAPSKQNGLPLAPGMSLGSQQSQTNPSCEHVE